MEMAMAKPSTSKGPVQKADSRITIKVKALTNPIERRGSDDVLTVNVVDSISKSVKTAFVPVQMMEKMKAGSFYLLKNVSVGQFIRLSETSKVMQCGKFVFPEDVERSFFTPPVVNVLGALSSPSKRRLSITGELSDVSSVITTATSRRKILKLSNDNETIEIKLWGSEADLTTPPVGHTVTVSCVNVSEYRGKKDANSTEMTEVKEDTEAREFEGNVEAACFDIEDCTILLTEEEDVCVLTHDQLLQVFPLEVFEESVRVRGSRQGSKILSIERIDA